MSEHRYLLRRFAVLAVFGVVVYGGVRVAATLTDNGEASGNEPPSPTAGTGSTTVTPVVLGSGTTGTTNTPPTTATPTTVAETGPPSTDNRSRVLVVGDSDAGTFGPYLNQILDRNDHVGELVDVTLDYKASTGLARPDYFDWPAHLERSLAENDPDIVVATWGGNDSQGLSEPCANGPRSCSPSWVVGDPTSNEAEWAAEYERRIDEVLEMMLEGGRRVIWVGIPNAKDPVQTDRLRIQDQTVRAALAQHPEVVFVDTWDMFDGGNGGYAEYVQDPRDGQAKPIRAGDGFHLNTTGAEILALTIYDEIEAVLRDLGADV